MLKKYITKQEDIKDCGASCISSIIKYFNGYIPMEVIREDTLTNKAGTTAFHIVKALNKYSFDVAGYKIENIEKEMIVLPAIAHLVLPNNLHHFVVIYKIDKMKKTILLMDPARGYKTLSIEEFNKLWTNILIIMKPRHKIPKYQKPNKLFKIFWKLFLEEKKTLLKILVISVLFMALSISSSFYIKLVLSNLNNYFYKIVIIFFIITIFKILLEYIRAKYQNMLNKNIDKKTIIPFLKHIFYLPLEYVKGKTTGEIITRIKELNNIKNLFSKIFVIAFLDLFLAISAMFFIFKINYKIFLILCLLLIIYFILSLLLGAKLKKNMDNLIEDETELNSSVVENIDGLETIKNNNQNDNYLNKTKDKFLKYLNTNLIFNNSINQQEAFKSIILELGIFLITTICLYYIYLGKLNTLDLITLNALLIYTLEALRSITNIIPEYYLLKSSFNKINEFIAIKEENLELGNKEFMNGDIKIKNMSYTYNHYNYILEDFNLIIKEGEKVIIKGPSGCGKSTLCKLIYRFYIPSKGNIKIGDQDISSYSIDVIRDNINYLSQKEKIFNDTIKNNIIFNQEIDVNYYNKILKICRVDELIKNKPFGDNTLINDDGFNLSGGEIQRIILARALFRKGHIIILDEALSEVEKYQEHLIIKDILAFFKNKTIIYVSHRDNEKLFDRLITLKQSKKIYEEGETL